MKKLGLIKSGLRVGLIQQSNVLNVKVNIRKLTSNIRLCASQNAKVIILPELHNTIYLCQVENQKFFKYSECIPGPSTKYFGSLAKELNVILVLSLFEKRAPGLYHNTAVVLEKDGTIAGKYRKMHIPDDPSYYEKFYFTPGDLGFTPIQTSIGKLGVMICWDQWYPEAARLMALTGADILIYPTAIGYDDLNSHKEKSKQKKSWIISQQAHAIHNGLFVISVNRCGYEHSPFDQTRGIMFWGNSFVCGPQGELIKKASDMEENLIVDIPLNRQESVRQIWPFFRDRRIDSYKCLTERFID